MQRFKKKGNRIRSSDKSLVFRFATGSLPLLFFMEMILLNLKAIITTYWNSVTLFSDGNLQFRLTPYRIVTLIISAFTCLAAALLYYQFRYDRVKQLFHRQKLARMILENGWYEVETSQDKGIFKDLPSNGTKERITYFPKMYYRMENGLLYIQTEITLGKYQDQLLHLEKKLETGLYCELVSKELHDSYVEYVLLYDTIANCITINEVRAKNGKLRLMKNVWWEYDKLPHMLIAGGTGGGKTYFILTIIETLLRCDSVMYVLDPKNADLADLAAVMSEVYYKKEDITACIDRFYNGMMERSETMKLMENYKTGENYAYLGLPPHFLIFDEYVAFMEIISMKFKKKDKELKPAKEKRVPVMKVGTHKRTVLALWLVLMASVSFGVYKNFTAIELQDLNVDTVRQDIPTSSTATEKELAYYVEGNVLVPVGCDYLYSELINPVFTKDGERVKVSVKYLDNRTKAAQISQFELTLEKDSNWKIVK